jgi:hypothetical protein
MNTGEIIQKKRRLPQPRLLTISGEAFHEQNRKGKGKQYTKSTVICIQADPLIKIHGNPECL